MDSEDTFHRGYDGACARAETVGPVLVLVGDFMVVFRGSQRRERRVVESVFHAIKAAAHMPVAAYAVAYPRAGRSLDPEGRRLLRALQEAERPSIVGMTDPHVVADMAESAETTFAFAADLLDAEVVSRPQIDSFARRAGPLLLRLTEHATRMQLVSMHAAVEEELARLDDDDRRALQVVVAGDHQARVRSLAIQYFQKRFGESPDEERRVTYGEGVESAEEARALVGKRRADRTIAAAFFGDPARLQRDVLGDAAASLLRNFAVTQIPPPRR